MKKQQEAGSDRASERESAVRRWNEMNEDSHGRGGMDHVGCGHVRMRVLQNHSTFRAKVRGICHGSDHEQFRVLLSRRVRERVRDKISRCARV